MTVDPRSVTLMAVMVALLATLPAAEAQQADKVWRIGYLGTRPPTTPEQEVLGMALLQGLGAGGFVEGRNLVIERRYSEGRMERFPDLAVELVRLRVDAILAAGGSTRAAKDATATIPIIMVGASDPVGAGFVASLARPGGNVTGIADLQVDLIAKRLELLKEAVPKVSRVVQVHGQFAGFSPSRLAQLTKDENAAAQALGLTLSRVQVSAPGDFETASAAIIRERPDALLLNPNPTNFLLRTEIAEFAAKHRLPTMAGVREAVAAGGLMAYGTDNADIFRNAGTYVAKILKGAKPADLPVEQPTKIDLIINLKTARALGLLVPPSLLVRASEVIQ